jgi:acetoin utilization protein AcuB
MRTATKKTTVTTSRRSATTGRRAPPAALVRQFMTRAPHTIGPAQTLAQAHEIMREHRIRHLPVLNGGRLVGMVSQRDLALIETLPGVNPAEVPVEDAMTQEVLVVAPGTPLARVAAEMADLKRGSAVVMEAERVVGLFTVTDACRALARLLSPGAGGPEHSVHRLGA